MDLLTVSAPAGPRPAPPRRWLAIINPAAGYHLAAGWLPALRLRLQRQLGAEVVVTRGFDHIAEVLAAAGDTGDVAVFGGDGTMAQVVNRIRLDRQYVLLLPGGTGNGLARDLGLTTIDHALAAAQANRYRAIDILEVTFRRRGQIVRRLVVSTAALGYAAETVAFAGRLSRRLGAWRYTLASALRLARMPASRFTVQLDDDAPRERRLTNIMVNNTRHAGNFDIFPDASLSDGQMDALLTDHQFGGQAFENVTVLMRVRRNRFGLEACCARSLHVRSAAPVRLMLDGETWDAVDEARFTVLPKRLVCYCP